MIYEGVNINVTLIFSLERYQEVTEAFIHGLEHRMRDGQPVTGIASVASFFVSRVDTLVDKLLDEKIAAASDDAQKEELRSLQGKAAIANARLAYEKYWHLFHGERFEAVGALGAAPQRCLWASTSTKNPSYRDVLYVEELIGPETVDTMPPATIVAFQDHGVANVTVDTDLDEMHAIMSRLANAGIDMAAVTYQLELEGVKSFADSYNKLIQSTGEKASRLARELQQHGEGGEAVAAVAAGASGGSTGSGQAAPNLAARQKAELGALQSAVDTALARAAEEQWARRVWQKDPALWKPAGSDQSEIVDRLGWLSVGEQMLDALPRLNDLREDVRNTGFTHAVLLGMGGSSLAPEVLRHTFGVAQGQPDLTVLDSTDPATLLSVERQIDLAHTLFIVSSKSGGTIETLSQFAYFFDKVHAIVGDQAGAQFIAITDPGTTLEQLGRDHHFRATFRNPTDIGGRYSALSYFGLVSGSLMGLDIEKLLDRAETMCQACQPSAPAPTNPGLWLGAIMGTLAMNGRDKVTLVMSPPVSTFGYWIEQLIAESTGKEGKGILPVEGEALGTPGDYGVDRLFVYLRTDEGHDAQQDQRLADLVRAGQPVVTIALKDVYDLGAEFFRWEFATAIAGAILGINAFNQPNVQEAKDRTTALLEVYTQKTQLPEPAGVLRTQHVSIVAGEVQAQHLVNAVSLQAALETYAREAGLGDYVALLAYMQRTPETDAALQHIRLRLRDARRVATTLGYGPRFQHSTGQMHKGGPNRGVFLQLVALDKEDAPIPGEPYAFGVLKQAQALGDLQSLQAHDRRVIRIDLGADVAAGLGEVRQAIDAAHLA
jgi:transaldolase/glucose-6-phosphate isomerase